MKKLLLFVWLLVRHKEVRSEVKKVTVVLWRAHRARKPAPPLTITIRGRSAHLNTFKGKVIKSDLDPVPMKVWLR